ncbi:MULTISPECIES: hypothetical protein [Pseudoalteromonas]|uniref:Uncharacterized protein n=1 Tax=Pseudoalteromonas obscura TaxID=3048491 RepID=A0ABT7EFK1_9GAMM|nr:MULTISPECIES: hypothetical protein [Pseudoalteromonas]MBQ4835694.1 hypothetical protein [Pseudoalteromonas luteoviolacea]MDK2594052.1 hypothetical protein [Pseudoalteromonas sp. P94(2023)]
MYKLFILFIFFSFEIFACGDVKAFSPFAINHEVQNKSEHEMIEYEILSPIQKGDEFLSSVTARLKGEFIVNLDIREDHNYVGEYYSSYISIAKKHTNDTEIILSYNTTKKDRSTVIFCANWSVYKLKELLAFEPAEVAPPPPPRLPDSK